MLDSRIDLARKPSRLRTSSPTTTPGLGAERPVRFSCLDRERSKKMSQATESPDAKGVAHGRDQRELTNSVGAPLTRRSKPSNGRWSTRRGRLGLRSRGEA